MKRRGIIEGLCVVLVGFLFSCQKPLAPDFKSVENINVSLNGFKSLDLSCDANFFNPNEKKITLKNVDIDINVDGKYLTNILKEYDLPLDPNSDFTVPVEAVILFKDVGLEDALALMRNTAGEKAFHFKGKIKVKMYGLNFSIPVDHNEVIRIN